MCMQASTSWSRIPRMALSLSALPVAREEGTGYMGDRVKWYIVQGTVCRVQGAILSVSILFRPIRVLDRRVER